MSIEVKNFAKDSEVGTPIMHVLKLSMSAVSAL